MRLLRLCFALSLLAGAAAQADSIAEVPLPANDLVYNPTSGLIYASVPGRVGTLGNTVTRIDPQSGQVVGSVTIGSEPKSLALTDDGQFLYVGLTGAGAVRRYQVSTNAAGPQWALGANQSGQPLFPGRIATLPGKPNSFAVTQVGDVWYSSLAVYEEGVAQTYLAPLYSSQAVDVVSSLSPGRLYYSSQAVDGLGRLSILPEGIRLLSGFGSLLGASYNNPNEFQRGLLFAPSGRVVDPEGGELLGTFSGILGYEVRICPDLPHGRVYFLSRDYLGSTCNLRAFDARTFALVGTVNLPDIGANLTRLVRWGSDGLAFGTDQKIYLIHSSLVSQEEPTVDLEVTSSSLPAQIPAGQPLSYTLTVKNAGASTATNVTVVDMLPATASIVSTSTIQGHAAEAGGMVTARLGDLAPNETATVTIQARFAVPGTTSHQVRAVAYETDTDPSDDQFSADLTVTAPLIAELNGKLEGAKATTPLRGKSKFTGKLTLRNLGGQDAQKFTVSFYASATPELTSPYFSKLADVKVSRVRAGKSAVVRLNKKAYRSNYQYLIAVIDPLWAVAEANEDDNTVITALTTR